MSLISTGKQSDWTADHSRKKRDTSTPRPPTKVAPCGRCRTRDRRGQRFRAPERRRDALVINARMIRKCEQREVRTAELWRKFRDKQSHACAVCGMRRNVMQAVNQGSLWCCSYGAELACPYSPGRRSESSPAQQLCCGDFLLHSPRLVWNFYAGKAVTGGVSASSDTDRRSSRAEDLPTLSAPSSQLLG